MATTTTVVLAGGSGRRMGEDKRLLRLFPSSPTFVERAVAVGRAVTGRVVIVGGPDVAWAETIPDKWPGGGPLGGLLTAADFVGDGHLLVLACDYPLLQVSFARRLAAGSPGTDAAISVDVEGRRHPLVATYATSAVEPVARRLIESGERSMSALLDAIDVRWMSSTAEDTLSLTNVNTPADLAGVREAALQRDRRGY